MQIIQIVYTVKPFFRALAAKVEFELSKALFSDSRLEHAISLMSHILIGSNVHWWNAEAAYAKATAEALQNLGHRIWIHTRPKTLNASHLKDFSLLLDVDFNSSNPYTLAISYHRFLTFLQKNQIQILHPHRSEGFLFYVRAAHLFNIPIIRTRGTARAVRHNFLNAKLYHNWINACVFPSQVAQRLVFKQLDIPKEKQHVIPYPVSSTDLESIPDYRKEFQISDQSIGIVGRLCQVKGHELLLQAFQNLLKQLPNTVLLVLYKNFEEDQDRLQELQQYSKTLGIEHQIRWIGHRCDIRNIMQFCNVGAVSSIGSEMICRVAVEFFSVGTPVVAFPTGCLPEVIKNEINGFCTKSINVDELTNALVQLLQNPSLCKKLGKQAQYLAQTDFSQSKFEQSWKTIYDALLA